MKKLLFFFGVLFLVVVTSLIYTALKKQSPSNPTLISYVVSPKIGTWSSPFKKTTQTAYGNTTGKEIQTTVTGTITEFMNFENIKELESQGFSKDISLAADGPGSSVWGYKRFDNDRTQIILFSYATKPTNNNLDQPLEFDCPCEVTLTVFLSEPFDNLIEKNKPQLANPASVNCEKVGGTLSIQTLGNGAQYGLCNFEDDMSCEEWALFRGNCPVGGVKTTGYDNTGQMYCAWLGGKTLAVPNSQCTLPDGTVCSTDSLYAGTCPSYTN